MSVDAWPTFIVGGVSKAGTTALYEYLRQHPDVFMSPHKEPYFFAFEGVGSHFTGPGDERTNANAVTDIAAYTALFRDAGAARARGEASAVYLYAERAAPAIKAHVPQARLVFLLREPVQRAFSSYLHQVREGWEPCPDFADALAAEETRIAAGWHYLWHYVGMGKYAAQIERYLRLFSREQILFILSEDLDADPVGTSQQVYRFVGVDHTFVPDVSVRWNATGVARSEILHSLYVYARQAPALLRRMVRAVVPAHTRRRLLNRIRAPIFHKPKLDPALHRATLDRLADDIARTGKLIGRDLGHWLG
jgi:hypothetical protein